MKKSTSITELKRMTHDELRRDIALHRTEYAKMRMGIEMQKEKNHAAFKAKRKDIARMMTVMTQMKNGTMAAPAKAAKASAPVSAEKPSQSAKKPVKSSGSKAKKA